MGGHDASTCYPASFPAVAAAAITTFCFEQLKKVLSNYSAVFLDQLGTQPMKGPPM